MSVPEGSDYVGISKRKMWDLIAQQEIKSGDTARGFAVERGDTQTTPALIDSTLIDFGQFGDLRVRLRAQEGVEFVQIALVFHQHLTITSLADGGL